MPVGDARQVRRRAIRGWDRPGSFEVAPMAYGTVTRVEFRAGGNFGGGAGIFSLGGDNSRNGRKNKWKQEESIRSKRSRGLHSPSKTFCRIRDVTQITGERA